MYEIVYGKKFKTAYKKLKKSGRPDFDDNELGVIVELLREGKDVPEKYHDHALKGNFQEQRECHLSGNLLLIYKVNGTYGIITLAEIGTHSELFKR